MPRKTLVVAHRTCPREEPENSLAGIAAAERFGADAVEVDVRATRDHVAVLLHDGSTRRTTDGCRLPIPVRWQRAATVTARRFRRDPTSGPPTLDEAIGALPPGLQMAIDTKADAAAPLVVAAVRRHRATDRVLLWSRSPEVVRHYAGELPGTPRALLRNTHDGRGHRRYLDDAVGCGATAVSLHQDAAHPDVVAGARRRGLTVFAWLQTLEAHERARHLGLDGIVTDWPVEARALLVPDPGAAGDDR